MIPPELTTALHDDSDDVPEGYWERLIEAMRRAPKLPDQDTTNDPPPIL